MTSLKQPDDEGIGRVDRRRYDRSDVLSTSLLLDLTTITVDPAYVEASARRVERGESPTTLRRGKAAAALLAAISLLAVVAFRHTRAGAPEAARVRSGLLARVQQLTDQTDADDSQLERLRRGVGADRDRALAAAGTDGDLTLQLRSVELAAAATPATGPGVTVRIAEAAIADAVAGARVQDRDLQRAVNIAWSAGAEAVAINGQRIGPLTAIRQAGDAILVDYRPVTSPYDVAVIGDQGALDAAYTVSQVSSGLRAIARSLDFTLTVQRNDRLQLAGTDVTRATLARPLNPVTPQIQVPTP